MTQFFPLVLSCLATFALWGTLPLPKETNEANTVHERTVQDSFPAELRQFLLPNTTIFAHHSADLNGDGTVDYVFVLEKQKIRAEDPDIDEGQRILKIAVRGADGTLRVVKSNDKIVFCSTCGGAFGDPFDELKAKTKFFYVQHYGGSNWRWGNTFTFAYSRRDNTWQLVLVEEHTFQTSNPDNMKSKEYKPPKDFGKIDISDFDPEKFKGVGKK